MTVLITGASRGIGLAIAEKFAVLNYNVVINYNKSEKSAFELRDKLLEINPNIIAVKADISNVSDVNKLFTEAEAVFGGVDVLINNAGISNFGLLSELSEIEYDKIFVVNMKSAYLCSKRAIPYLLKKKYGRIINISSVWGVLGASCEVAYSSSKAALIGFTKSLAKELALSGITVNCIAPGFIQTEMNLRLTEIEKHDFILEIPLKRMGKPHEIAHAAAFLADENSSYITGQILSVDGGLT